METPPNIAQEQSRTPRTVARIRNNYTKEKGITLEKIRKKRKRDDDKTMRKQTRNTLKLIKRDQTIRDNMRGFPTPVTQIKGTAPTTGLRHQMLHWSHIWVMGTGPQD